MKENGGFNGKQGKFKFCIWEARRFKVAVTAGLLMMAMGCAQTNLTSPKRSAVEQLLLSTAADRAWEMMPFGQLDGKKVYVEERYFNSYDDEYAIGALRDTLSSRGALLVKKEDAADVVVEPRSGALSIDGSNSLIGIPKLPMPIPFAGSVETPEVALFKSDKQFSTAKFAFLAVDRSSGQHVMSTGPLVGRANIKYYKILGIIKFTKTTIPEKQKGAIGK